MEEKIQFLSGELIIEDSQYIYKCLKPFTLTVIEKSDFAGINIVDARVLKYSDWNYAFRFGAIGLALYFGWSGIGYAINGLTGDIGRFFTYTSIVFEGIAGFGGYIIFFYFWDALFGSTITDRLLLKMFGKKTSQVIIASKTGRHIEFNIFNEDERRKIDDLMKS